MTNPETKARIVTFYSYKGGTGRSMALANVAWILAANGKRVAVIDWDLEAPGLHRYLHPYLRDPELLDSSGIIDFVMAYAREAIKPAKPTPDTAWYLPHANLLRHASSLCYDFPAPGTIDFIPSGRQGADYAARVNSFNWSAFYEKQQGGIFLEAAKQSLSRYDYVLIDSRTGVSDTSGICTVQMPHVLVVCFTPNAQSIQGASAIARSADQQRTRADGTRTLTILPVMMRVLAAEKERVEAAKRAARNRFDGFLWHLSDDRERDQYWGRTSVPQEPFYAFEEVLAVFGDEPGLTNTMLASMETLAGYITGAQPIADDTKEPELRLPRLDDAARRVELGKFVTFVPTVAKPEQAVSSAAPEEVAIPVVSPAPKLEPGGAGRYWFYLSCATQNADTYVQRFYSDLTVDVGKLVGANDPAEVGFFDRSTTRPGDTWPPRTADALATARTLVPIVSPQFLLSEYCGKEWQVFEQRRQLGGRAGPAILPVIWVPVPPEDLPPAVSEIQLWSHDFPDAYRAEGLLYLTRLRRTQYREFVWRFARWLVDRARDTPAPIAKEPPQFERVANAFARQESLASARSGPNVIEFVLMAGSRAEMASIRSNTDCYRDAAKDWSPYPPMSVASSAVNAASSHNRIANLSTTQVDLQELQRSNQLAIVIIDPWALKLNRVGQELSALDEYEPTSWGYVFVFDGEQDTRDKAPELQGLLAQALPNTHRAWPRKVREVHSEKELTEALASMMTALQLELISRATATSASPAPLPKTA
jgi:FxsC-like protein